ncbi:MAG: hypothetical protein RIS84_367 [Pseudomonadota bacterium]|jgi:hypothetical protein
MTHLHELYQKNYTEWAEKTADLLKRGQFSELDIEHLLEELASMGASEQNELESPLTILIAHLLKWQFQYQQLSDKWKEFFSRSQMSFGNAVETHRASGYRGRGILSIRY